MLFRSWPLLFWRRPHSARSIRSSDALNPTAFSIGCSASASDDAEQQKNAAADQIEGKNLTQRLRMGDESEKAKTDQRLADKPSQRCGAHRGGARRGGPATSVGRVTAMDTVIKVSMKRINGLAKPAG